MKVPQGWRILELGELADMLTGFAFRSADYSESNDQLTAIRLLRGDNIGQGVLRWNEPKLWPREQTAGLERYWLGEGDLVIAMDRTWVKAGLKIAITKASDLPCLLVQRVARLRGNDRADSAFLGQVVASSKFVQYVKTVQTETAIPHISAQQIRELRLLTPPLHEQRRIAEILGSWDRAIETHQKLLTAKTTRLSTLRHQLLTGAKRFPEFQKRGVWPRTRLEKAAEEMSVRNKGNVPDHKLFAVTKAEGLVPMKDRVKGISTQRCMVVEQDWYAYNPMRINIGSIARHYSPEPVMVSPDYVVFRAKPAVLLPDYLDHLRRSQLWSEFVSNAGSGSVRVRIYFDALGLLSFPLPTIAEQTRITTFLNACQREIDLLATQLEALKQQKRGMMQKLLTGEIRTNS